MKIKIVLITTLIVLLFTNLACANTCYLENGRLYIYDDIHNKILSVYGNPPDINYDILITNNGIAYAAGRGGYTFVDIDTGSVIMHDYGGGAAGFVHDLDVTDKYIVFGYENTILIYDNTDAYNPIWASKIDTMIMVPDCEIKGTRLYINDNIFDISNVNNPRCLNPGAFIAIYDGSGTWAVEYVETEEIWHATEIGFGWSGCEPIIGDWDGDGFKNVGIYNRAGNNFLIPANNEDGYEVVGLGWAGVTPVTGDFDGDGDDDVGVYDNKGTWALNTNTGVRIVGFGWAGIEPVVGDWNGDGVDEVGIYNRPGNNFLIPRDSSYYIVGLGWEGVIPIVGNWDSDINDEVGVYAPDTSAFALAGKTPFTFGKSGSQPVVGDVDFNGITEVGVCEPDGTIKYKTDEPYYVGLIKWEGSTLIGC